MKKITTIIMTTVLALGVFAGCSNGSTDKETPENTKNVTLEEIHTAVKDAYGENYLPNMEIPAEMLEAEFGLTKDLYAEVIAEQPMIGTHADRVVLVKAAEGKADAVEEALNKAKENKIADTMQYPMNLPKIAATKVVRHGDVVAFLLVGAINENMDATEEEAKTFAETEVEKAVEAINNLFK
ncbi:MAG TPA: hypothetical protein DEF30_11255 [Proteiniclasticum sp.]|uniref:DUF4358 domain-containing protein n=1 Tax=Proteiniclasticum sp. TaxID=2053595 RepID=UPI000E8C4467|nr:DUF4358 domain-containing protein [Proteiniclasticum sp.]HBW14383.1 hypothetical protein [Proteiniclasticum sp.]